MDDEAEHLAQHRDVALALANNQEDWVRLLNAHLAQMHGVESASDPAFLHRHLHPPGASPGDTP